MALKLKEVTLICFDTRNIEAALDSMELTLSHVSFSESILFTSKTLCSENIKNRAKTLGIKLELVNEIKSITDYSYFILAKLDLYVQTKFCLVTQWDSWVINPSLWDLDFLNYDYIGAMWSNFSENQIGNGGFSLRSKKLLWSTKNFIVENPDFEAPLIEDVYICRDKRHIFEEKYQIKFPSNEIANNFSVEGSNVPFKSFGFHGMSNFNFALKKDSDLIRLINKLNDDCFKNRASYDLTKYLLKENRINLAKLIIRKRFKINGISTKQIKLILIFLIRFFLINIVKKFLNLYEKFKS
jgi:hypothetical protein